jgi:uncharacterized protein with PhoU and TrkA domain
MLAEAKDTSELMVDLAYASVYFGDDGMAEEVFELEHHMSELVHDMRAVCVLAARHPREADGMSSVLQVVSAIERIANAAVDIARIVTHRLGIPPQLVADLSDAEEVSHRVLVSQGSHMAHRPLSSLELPVQAGMRVMAIRRERTWNTDVEGDTILVPGDVLFLRGSSADLDPSPLRGLIQLAEAAEDLGDQAQQMVWLIEQQEDVPPIIGIALGDSDDVVMQLPVAAGSEMDGATLAQLQLAIEPGFTVMAIRRGGGYLYRPRGHVRLAAGDELIASGPEEGRAILAHRAGWVLQVDEDTGETELLARV